MMQISSSVCAYVTVAFYWSNCGEILNINVDGVCAKTGKRQGRT